MAGIPILGHARSFGAALAKVKDLCARAGFSPRRSDEALTCVVEAIENAAEHGPPQAGRSIRVFVRLEGEAVVVDVLAEGSGPAAIAPIPDLRAQILGRERPSGWGLYLMRSFASEIAYIDRGVLGHCVRLRFGAETPAHPVEPRIVRSDDVQ